MSYDTCMPTYDLTTEQAAELLNVSQRTIQRIVAHGKLSAQIINPWSDKPIYRLDRKEVEALRKKQQTGPLKPSS